MDFKERYQYNPKTDLLGKGGFARVFKAYDQILHRYVALKVFSVEVSGKYDLVSEIRKVITLENANLCRYYDVAFIEGVTVMGEEEKLQVGIMEYLDGGDLKSYCQRHPHQQQKLLTDVLKGLSFLHKRGIIHRDLKPANILIKNTEDGPVAKITDFGISKDVGGSHTSSSLLMGTIEYMAPEQFSPAKYGIGGKIGTNLDLWSFGLMVYEMVTGHSLFGSRGSDSSAEQVMGNILNDELIEDKLANLPEPYLSVVRKCLVKDAKQRVQGADELISLLEGKTYAPPVPTVQETVVLPKTSTAQATAETIVITKDKETVALPQPPPTAAKKKGKTGLLLAALAVILMGSIAGWFMLSKPGYVKLYPVMDKATTKWGFADSTGKMVIPYQYDWADTMFNGVARINLNHKFGLVNDEGKFLTELKYHYLGRIYETVGAFRLQQGGLFGFINKDGKEIIKPKYYDVCNFSNGLAMIVRGSKYGFIDGNGNEVIAPKFDYFGNNISSFHEGLAAVQINGKWGFINHKGDVIISARYDFANRFSEGYAQIWQNEKSTFIDKTGKEISSSKYDISPYNISAFSNGLAAVYQASENRNTGKFGFINKKGEIVIPLKYEMAFDFSEGLANIKENGKWYFINKSGMKILKMGYDHIDSFSEGLAHVENGATEAYFSRIGGKNGYIDKTGKELILLKYSAAGNFSEGLAKIMRYDKEGYIDKTGKELTNFK